MLRQRFDQCAAVKLAQHLIDLQIVLPDLLIYRSRKNSSVEVVISLPDFRGYLLLTLEPPFIAQSIRKLSRSEFFARLHFNFDGTGVRSPQ